MTCTVRGFCYIRPLYNEVPLYLATDWPVTWSWGRQTDTHFIHDGYIAMCKLLMVATCMKKIIHYSDQVACTSRLKLPLWHSICIYYLPLNFNVSQNELNHSDNKAHCNYHLFYRENWEDPHEFHQECRKWTNWRTWGLSYYGKYSYMLLAESQKGVIISLWFSFEN